MRIETVTTYKYIAFDNTEFDTEVECLAYEAQWFQDNFNGKVVDEYLNEVAYNNIPSHGKYFNIPTDDDLNVIFMIFNTYGDGSRISPSQSGIWEFDDTLYEYVSLEEKVAYLTSVFTALGLDIKEFIPVDDGTGESESTDETT